MSRTISEDVDLQVQAVDRVRPRRSWAHQKNKGLVYTLLIAGSVVFILPFLWMLTTSLKASQEVFTFPPDFFPTTFQWQNYLDGWNALPFTRFLVNTILVTGSAIIGNLVSCSLAAYAFARLQAPGKRVLFICMLGTLMIPAEVTIVPTFILFTQMKIINTLWTLALPPWFGYAFFIFLLRQFFMTIPRELDDAARIEGASDLMILTRIILPLSKPALATVAIFSFLGNWNNLLSPLIFLRSTDKFTLALGLRLFQGQYTTMYNQLMAVSIVTILPIIVTFFFAQKYFIRGVALTGTDR